MSWRSDWPNPELLPSAVDGRPRRALRWPDGEPLVSRLRRLRAQISRPEPPRRPPNPVLIEEEAMVRLYGSRTGTVSPSTTRAPVSPRPRGPRAAGGSRPAGPGAAR